MKTKPMTHRDRFLTAINNEKPDRLPCQVHGWMEYYLKTYLGGMEQYQAYDHFGMGKVIYISPDYIYSDRDKADWDFRHEELGQDEDGNWLWAETVDTPKGTLTTRGARNKITTWTIEDLIKSETDFEAWNSYVPIPERVDWTPVIEAKNRIGDDGIVRGSLIDFGQNSPWQSFCILYGTEPAIMAGIDKPDWLHFALESMLKKKLSIIEHAGRQEFDIVESGGGAGSSTVISPKFFREFCLPCDKIQHKALKEIGGVKIVYHLCGGLMPMLDLVVESGADGLETMTPPGMGGDCDLAEASRRVGDKLFFIGGFDQNRGFEKGTPEIVREMVRQLHAACPDGGYICSPSDHFFNGAPENIQAFVDAARECDY